MTIEEDFGTEENTAETPSVGGRKTNALKAREAQIARERENRQKLETRRKSGALHGYNRDRMRISNGHPNYVYYWALDGDETGSRLLYLTEEVGYEFVDAKRDPVRVGDGSVYESVSHGSIYRAHNRDGRFLYLLRIRREWFEQDQKDKDNVLKEQEEQIFGANGQPLFGPSATYFNKTKYE